MTTLYRPVLISSAEQAEALPDDAIVISVETGERYTRGFEGDWWGVTEMGTRLAVDLYAGDVVTALVPIEAEEEYGTQHGSGDPHVDVTHAEALAVVAQAEGWGDKPPRVISRLVTPWEES